MSASFTAIPALDVRQGKVVRLRQGDYDKQTDFPGSPLQLASDYAQAGAQWLHLVDLDAARSGGYSLLPLVRALAAETTLKVQTGGGVRLTADVEALLAAGASRVVVGTVAIREPDKVCDWLHQFGAERITLALDVRRDGNGDWRLPVAGWTEASPATLDSLLARYSDAGVRHVLCTDIARDGMLAGYSLDLYRELASRWPGLQFQASGGVRDVADIKASRAAGASGAILGRALLEGRFTLAEALAC